MKFKQLSAFLLSLLVLASLSLPAQTPLKAWSATSTTVSNVTDTVAACIVSAYSGDSQGLTQPAGALAGSYRGPAFVTYLQAFSDTSTARLQFYVETNSCPLAPTNGSLYSWSIVPGATNIPVPYATNSSGTPVGATNGFGVASNTVCVIRHKATDTYERNRIWGCFGTNVIFQYPLVTTPAAGDIVYLYQASAVFNLATNGATPFFNGRAVTTIGPATAPPGIVNGVVPGTPFLFEVTGGGQIYTNSINASGGYLP